MPIAPREIRARDVSDAWLQSVELLDSLAGDHAYHHVVRIQHPDVEHAGVRRVVDKMLADLMVAEPKLQPVDTVRNTVFPEAWSRKRNPDQLAKFYRSKYEWIKGFPANRSGTYFGRMVDLPTDDSENGVDQLNIAVNLLRAPGRQWKTRYDTDLSDVGSMQIRSKRGNDQLIPMGFPCLSFCAFQREARTLHMVAHYRNHYVRERAYGNYLGLGQLLRYVAEHTDKSVGSLTVIAGHAEIEKSLPRVRNAAEEGRRLYAKA